MDDLNLIKISDLPPTGHVSAGDVVPVVQSGVTKQVPSSAIRKYVNDGLGSAAFSAASDFEPSGSMLEVDLKSQARADAQNERIDRIEVAAYLLRNNKVFKAYRNKALMLADVANIPAQSILTVVSDPKNNPEINDINGQYHWDGKDFFKLPDDILSLIDRKADAAAIDAKEYADQKKIEAVQEAKKEIKSESIALHDYVDDSLEELSTFTINSGKPYPFQPLIRKNMTSKMHMEFANAILDVVVVNADPNKFYKIEFIMNGYTGSNPIAFNKDGWGVYAYDKDKFADSTYPNGDVIINYAVPQPLIDRTKITKVILKPTYKSDLSIEVIIDGRKLPAYGLIFLRSANQDDYGFSWIIDPICYKYKGGDILYKEQAPREFLYNRGPYYPFIEAKFNNILSVKHDTLLDVFKDAKVENAEDGYRYSLAYYTNGSTALGADKKERWIVLKRKVDGYTEAGATETQIVSVNVEQQTLLKSGGIESITLKSLGKELFHITVDTAKLPAYGFYMGAATTEARGYSWYLSPSTYTYAQKNAVVQYVKPYFSYDAASKGFIYRFKSGPYFYEWGFGINGVNGLPNFKHIKRSSSTDIENGVFETLQSFATDWLPPLVFQSVNNGTDNSQQFTGGNHASNGDATGDPTAANEAFIIYINGEQVDMTKNVIKYVDQLDLKIINKIMASNTKSIKRYVLRQIFDLRFNSSSINVHCDIKPLEKIIFFSDYALQLVTTSFEDTVLMLDSQDISRVSYSAESKSGVRQDFPNANAAVLKGSGGILCSWMDRNYGNGTPENCAPDLHLINAGGGTNKKLYHKAFRSFGTKVDFQPLSLDVDDTYKWRGGYYLGYDNKTDLFDSVVNLGKITAVIDGNNYF